MIIAMDELFRLEIVQKSKDPQKVRFSDPHEVAFWAQYFGLKYPSDLLVAFGYYMLRVLRLRVQHSVETQTLNGYRMSILYRQLSRKYRKKNPKNTDKFWLDTEFLIDSIRVWRDPTRITKVYFGIPKNIIHPESKVEARLIFRWLEFGTKKNGRQIIPPRPLIYPHLKFVLAHKTDYWVYFIKLLIDKKITLKAFARK